MAFNLTIFGPGHHFWKYELPRVWFWRPDACSTGGTGFCIPFLHVCFTWGRRASVQMASERRSPEEGT